MGIGERENTASGWRGIWRASVPAIIAAVRLPSPKRQSRPRLARLRGRRWKLPAPIAAALFAFLLFAQASALPMHLGFILLPPHARVMTQGCEKGSCCTALCYLDKHGFHHCVHMPGDSCECGISTDDCQANPVFLSAIITLPKIDNLLPNFVPSGWVCPLQDFFAGRTPATPSPPPK